MWELIPILALSIPIIAITTQARNKRLKLELEHGRGMQDNALVSKMQAEIHDLKDRIAVLERIVTEGDGAASLNREIEKLREKN